MLRLVFYRGPGDLVTKVIRLLTHGPYSHVELQFDNGVRFYSSGHGITTGTNMVMDNKIYGPLWDSVYVPATVKEEREVERFAFRLIGFPFDWRGLLGFVFPFLDRKQNHRYCSAVVLDVLQRGLHMFPGVALKISPNGLYRLFLQDPEYLVG